MADICQLLLGHVVPGQKGIQDPGMALAKSKADGMKERLEKAPPRFLRPYKQVAYLVTFNHSADFLSVMVHSNSNCPV